jgi:hypothetical protein
MMDIAELISREAKFIIRWVEARLRKTVPKRPDKHDHSVMILFSGGDQVQYVSNVHRDDAAVLMIDLLRRWKMQGILKTDIPYHAKKEDVSGNDLVIAVTEEIVSLLAEPMVRGHEPVDGVIILEDVLLRGIRMISKKDAVSQLLVFEELTKAVRNKLKEGAN